MYIYIVYMCANRNSYAHFGAQTIFAVYKKTYSVSKVSFLHLHTALIFTDPLSPCQTTGWSALMLAAVNNQTDVVVLLLQHGARRETEDISKRTAAQLVVVLGHREAAQVLDGESIGE